MLCPGFIDLHTHSALRSFDDPFLTPKLAQGFTTEVINPDGLAPAPVDPARRAERQAYLRPLEGPGPEEWPWSTVGGVPRRARRDAARALARPLDRPRRGARRRARRRARRPHRGAGWRRCAARSGSASTRARGCCPSGSSTSRAPSRRPASSSRSPRRRRGRACRSSRTFATRVTACSRRSRR